MLHHLDDFLFNRLYQPICDALYERVGDCIVIARQVLLHGVAITAAIGLLWLYDLLFLSRVGIPKVALVFFLLEQVFIGTGLILCRTALRRHLGNTGPNPLRFFLYPARIAVVVWTAASMVSITCIWLLGVMLFPVFMLEIVRNLVMQSAIYFACCHNRPPVRAIVGLKGRGYSPR